MNRNIFVKFLVTVVLVLSSVGLVFAQTTTDAEPTLFDWFNVPQTDTIKESDSLFDRLQETVKNLPEMLETFEAQQNGIDNDRLIGPSLTDEITVATEDLSWLERITASLRDWRAANASSETPRIIFSDSWNLYDLFVE